MLYHTSPVEIKKIHHKGRYGPGLFFSDRPYYMTQSENPHLYGYEPEEGEIIDPNDFNNLDPENYKKIKHIVKDISNRMGVDEESALSFLSQNKDPHSFYNELESHIENSMDDEDEEIPFKKQLYKHLSKFDLGELSWDLQAEALKAANILGKKGVKTPDETGISYLINLFGNESKLKKISNK